MGLVLAWKAFWRALKDPEGAHRFIAGASTSEEKSTRKKEESVAHLQLLTLLQQGGRLIDFFKEDISSFSDAQVGAAARQVHEECAKLLEETVTIRPVMEQEEGSAVQVAAGYNPHHIKLTGQVAGNPPYKGRLVHGGWKAHKQSLPKQVSNTDTEILAPAEVEI